MADRLDYEPGLWLAGQHPRHASSRNEGIRVVHGETKGEIRELGTFVIRAAGNQDDGFCSHGNLLGNNFERG